MRPRLQFSLRSLLVLVLAVSCFLAGAAWQKKRDEPVWIYKSPSTYQPVIGEFHVEIIKLRDGSEWQRMIVPIGEPPDKPRKQPASTPASPPRYQLSP